MNYNDTIIENNGRFRIVLPFFNTKNNYSGRSMIFGIRNNHYIC